MGTVEAGHPAMQSNEAIISKIEREFTYHSPFGTQPERYVKIREKAKELAILIIETTPICADQTAAIRKLRECVMTANAAIAINEVKPPEPNQP